MISFSARLKEILKNKNMTQIELAEKSNTTAATISRYLNNNRTPNINLLNNIASALNVTTDYLIGNTNNPTPPGKKKDDPTPETEGCYIFVAGKNGIRKKYPVPAEKMERFKKLVEAGFPEIFDNQDDL